MIEGGVLPMTWTFQRMVKIHFNCYFIKAASEPENATIFLILQELTLT